MFVQTHVHMKLHLGHAVGDATVGLKLFIRGFNFGKCGYSTDIVAVIVRACGYSPVLLPVIVGLY